jgi:hypothetical protein
MLTQKDISQKISEILWGKSFVDVKNECGDELTFVLRTLTIAESNKAQYIYNKELTKCQHVGILCFDEMKKILCDQGVWSKDHDNRIEYLKSKKILALNQIKDFEMIKHKRVRLERALKKIEEEIDELTFTRNNFFGLTAETRAEEIKRRYMIMMSTEDVNGNAYWPTERSFLDCDDQVLLFNLAKLYYNNNLLSEKDIRKIARSGEWRYRWNASKGGESLFGTPVAEWSEPQDAVVFWSGYYDSVFACTERPSSATIENDEMLDLWVEDYNKRIRSGSKTQSSNNAFGNRTAKKNKDHNEVFMKVDRGDEEAIRKVQEMNTSTAREKIRAEQQQISKLSGGQRIKEWDLGDRKHTTSSQIVSKGRKGR